MLIFNALTQILSMRGHIARRPSGVMLMVSDRAMVHTFRTGKPRRWCPKLLDLLADDWEVVSLERLIDETNQMAEMQNQANVENTGDENVSE